MKCPECEGSGGREFNCGGVVATCSCKPCHGTGEVPDDESHLPTLMSVRGIAPDITGDLSSEDYVRRQRDAWPEPEETADDEIMPTAGPKIPPLGDTCPCQITDIPAAPRFKPGDRVMVEGEIVRARGDEIHIRISNGYWEHVILMFLSGVHPMPEEGE